MFLVAVSASVLAGWGLGVTRVAVMLMIVIITIIIPVVAWAILVLRGDR